jgi:hypothetical protein
MGVASEAEQQQWEEEGWCLLSDLFAPQEVQEAQSALPDLFPTAAEFDADTDPDRNAPMSASSIWPSS